MRQHPPAEGFGGRAAPPGPDPWAAGRLPAAFRWSAVFLVLVLIGTVAAAASAFVTGDPGSGIAFAVGALVVGHVVGFCLWAWRTPRRSGRNATLDATPDGGTGVRFGYWFWTYYWFTALLLITGLVCLALTVLAGASATPAGVVIAVVAGIAGLAIAWVLVTELRLAPGGLTVTPAGVYHRSLTFTHFVPWDAVLAVDAGWLGTPVVVVKAAPTPDTRVRRYTGRFGTGEQRVLPFLAVRAYWLATDPATVYHALAFYHAYPRLRAELDSRTALDRIGNLGTEHS